MSYRNITINDTKYKYVTGKTHTKIVNVGVYKNTDIGSLDWKLIPCECCGDYHKKMVILNVTPKDIANIIKNKESVELPINKFIEEDGKYFLGDVKFIE
jgi:hypothetical protein